MLKLLATLALKIGGGLLGFAKQASSDVVEHHRIDTSFDIEALKADAAARAAAASIVIAEQGHWSTRWIRPAFAWPLILWWAAVIADSMYFHSGSIKALPVPLDEWAGWIVAAYFVMRPVEKIGRNLIASRRR